MNALELTKLIISLFTCMGVIVAIFTFIQARRAFFAQHERASKQLTIEFLHTLMRESYEIEKLLRSRYGTDPIILADLSEDELYEIWQFLSRLERFSAGVNAGILNLTMANRQVGNWFIYTYNQLYPYIKFSRDARHENRLFEEFEYMKTCMESLRSTYAHDNTTKYMPDDANARRNKHR